jgi:uncharacterized protein (DUF58 family)
MHAVWIAVVVVLLAIGQTLYYNRRAIRRVQYSRSFSRSRVFAGEDVELTEVLSNDKLLPVPWVRVESRISSYLQFQQQENLNIAMDRFHKSLFFLGSYSRITRRHRIRCARRGYYDCSLVSIVAGDLFGLARDKTEKQTEARLLVYPPILPPSQLPDTALKWQGDVTARRWILPDPILVTGIRDYRSGDPQRDVHWGATARTGKLQVKQRDFTVSPRALLVMNCQISPNLMGGMEPNQLELLEHGVTLAASLAAWCVRSGVDVGLLANGENQLEEGVTVYVEPRCSDAHLDRILRELSLLRLKKVLHIDSLLDKQLHAGITDMDVLILSAYWDEGLEYRARALRRQGCSVTWLRIHEGVI